RLGLEPFSVHTEPFQIRTHRLRATISQRKVVFVGAARIGVSGEQKRSRRLSLEAIRVTLNRGRALGCHRGLVEVEVNRIELAARRAGGLGPAAHAHPSLALLVLRAVAVAPASLGARALAALALAADAALVVRRARLALAVETRLAGRTLVVGRTAGGFAA